MTARDTLRENVPLAYWSMEAALHEARADDFRLALEVLRREGDPERVLWELISDEVKAAKIARLKAKKSPPGYQGWWNRKRKKP